MTPLTQCDLRESSRSLLRPAILLRVAVAAGVAVMLALGLTHLRFGIRDLQIESNKLQRARLALISHKNTVLSEVERLKRYERLKDYAQTKLGLRECSPDRSVKVMVSPGAIGRWKDLIEETSARKNPSLPPAERLLMVLTERVISLSSVSLAHEPVARAE